jgi:branched-chain amino acid transport system ATP-binding protein
VRASSDGSAMLEVTGVTKRFGGLIAVAEASIQVREGEIVALIGPNGAGKTTLFGIIAGFIPADRGSVRFLGGEVLGIAPHLLARRGLVRTFQIVQPFAGLSVRENIAVGCQLRQPSRAAALREADEVARRVGMGDLIDRPVGALTIAGRKRLELARALATRPRLLLLDEVMAGLNPVEIAEMVPLIRAIRDAGVTVLLTEHVMAAVMSLAERVYVLNDGQVIAEGEPAEIVADAGVIEAYLGHGAAERLARHQTPRGAHA